MASRKVSSNEDPRSRRPPATTPEGREQELVAMAVNLAEKQIAEGTVSSQVLSHYLKMGSTRERLEQKRLQQENAFLRAKIDNMASGEKIEALYENAIKAMKSYTGQDDDEMPHA